MTMHPRLSDRLVLLVDDETSILEGMHAWLRDNQAGFAVMGASDGVEALELVKKHKPDLIVSDVRMPRMDGLELLLVCRRTYPEIGFILMSAHSVAEIERRSMLYGAVRFLHKPVDLPMLEETIVQVLHDMPAAEPGTYLKGISVPGFTQLLNMEHQTGSLLVSRQDGASATLFFDEGTLVHAVAGELTGEPAAMEALGWDEVDMILQRDRPAPVRSIDKPLNFLLMESMRHKDEAGR